MKWTLGTAFVLFTCGGALAVPVNHDAVNGIAAVATPSGESAGAFVNPVLVLSTDGEVYSVGSEGELKLLGFADGENANWPVEFSEIIDWLPGYTSVGGRNQSPIMRGVITTRGGETWVQTYKVSSGGWDTQSDPQKVFKWHRIAVPR